MNVYDEDDDAEVLEGEVLDLEEEPDLGPDERDADLMDGTWERRHYAQPEAERDWRAVYVAIALLVVASMVLPLLFAVTR